MKGSHEIKMEVIILLSLLNTIFCQYTTVYTKYGNYCGYLNNNKKFEPIDITDRCCQLHDLCCEKYGMKNIDCHKRFANCIFEVAEYYKLDGYPLKLYNSVKRINNCYKNQIESNVMMGGGALLLATPLAPFGFIIMGLGLIPNEGCIYDAKYILQDLYYKLVQ